MAGVGLPVRWANHVLVSPDRTGAGGDAREGVMALWQRGTQAGSGVLHALGRYALASVLAACWGMANAQATPTAPTSPWLMVQPLERIQVADAMARHFARTLPAYLGEPVVVHQPSHAQEVAGVLWALREAPAAHTLILMSALLLTRLEDAGVSDLDHRMLVPLQMVLEGAWCLAAPASRALSGYDALQRWLATLGRPVQIALPGDYGTLRLWVRAMERKTRLRWQMAQMSHSVDAVRALRDGRVDLLMDRCQDMEAALQAVARSDAASEPAVAQVLARAGTTPAFQVPSFGEWKLPPMSAGWMAWFAPVGMPPKRQQVLESALHAVMQREDTRKLLQSMGRVPVLRTPQQSRERVRQLQREWRQLQQWLDSTVEVSP